MRMTENGSARFGLPFIESGQAQKELAHNEALALIDVALHASVESAGVEVPPAAPAVGQCWIVGANPSGDWAGHSEAIAGWTAAGWRFVTPREGSSAWDRSTRQMLRHDGGIWESGVVRGARVLVDGVQVVGRRAPALDAPAGGATVDAEARAAIGQILGALRNHGLIAS